MRYLLFLILFLVFISSAISQIARTVRNQNNAQTPIETAKALDDTLKSNEDQVQDYTKKVRETIDAIGDLSPEDYFSKIDGYRDEVERFMETKRLVCNGDFSSVVLTGNGQGTVGMGRQKLSQEERSLCLNEAKALQVTYINNRYKSRKRYLDELHKQRIDELAKIREESIKNLQRDFSE